MSTPRGPGELVPGNIPELRAAAKHLAERATEWSASPDLAERASRAATAHQMLAEGLADLRSRAEVLYLRSNELGIGDELLADSRVVLGAQIAHPQAAREITSLVQLAIEIRLGWVEAQQDFVDGMLALAAAQSG